MENSKVRTGEISVKNSTQKMVPKVDTYEDFIRTCHLDGKEYDFKNLPEELSISTMTIVCHTNIEFNVKNIGEQLELDKTIPTIKYNTNERTILIEKMKKKVKNSKRNFYNQVSISVQVDNDKKINIKLFINGSIQITGCKKLDNMLIGLTKLFKKIHNLKYVNDLDKLTMNNIYDIKIVMINSNFDVGFTIDRDKLFYLIKNKTNYICMYDANYHACVDIKYEMEDKIISIFVFESGSVVITGSRNCLHVINAFEFIYEFLIENYQNIIKNKIIRGVSILDLINI